MALFFDANQSPRVTTPALNSVNRTGDPGAGVLVTTANVSGSIVQEYTGMIGGMLTVSQADVVKLEDTGTGVLYGGVYRYVKFLPVGSTACVRGGVALWLDTSAVSPTCYNVTNEGSTARNNFPAGIFLNVVTKGYYDWIQVAGLASVKFKTALGTATPAIGDAVFVADTPASPQLADDLNDSASITPKLLKQFLGVAEHAAPVSATVSAVLLDLGRWPF
jgi:hypothetical protein